MQLNSYLCLSLTSYKHSHTLSNCCCHINTLTGSETAAVLCPEALDIRPYGLLWVGHMWGFRQGSGDWELRGSQGKYYKPIHSDSEKIHTVFEWWGFLFSFLVINSFGLFWCLNTGVYILQLLITYHSHSSLRSGHAAEPRKVWVQWFLRVSTAPQLLSLAHSGLSPPSLSTPL